MWYIQVIKEDQGTTFLPLCRGLLIETPMNWLIAALTGLIFWSIYSIFGDRATQIHGEKISMLFETVAFVLLLAFVATQSTNGSTGFDFSKMTTRSALFGAVMGITSAAGFYCLLLAFKLGPSQTANIVLITGFYPVLTAVLLSLFGTRLSGTQWAGIALASVGLFLVNWKR